MRLLLLFLSFLSLAQTQKETIDDLLTMDLDDLLKVRIVTASKYIQDISEAPSVMTVVTRYEMEQFGGNSLFEVLERVTNIYMTGSFFFPQNLTAMRGDLLGQYDNHILILFNGRPLRESYLGGTNFSIYTAFPLKVIDRLEIIRGPGSVLYGTNAYSGVINIITKEINATESHYEVNLGSFGTRQFSAYGASYSDEIRLNGGITFFKEKGWEFQALDNVDSLGQMDATEENFGAFLHGKLRGFEFNSFYASSIQNFMGATSEWSDLPNNGGRTMESHRFFTDIGYTTNLNDDQSVETNLSYGRMLFDHYNYKSFSDDIFLETTHKWRPLEEVNLVSGLSYWYQEVGSRTHTERPDPVPEFDSYWLEAYSQIDYRPIETLKLIAGVQINKPEKLETDFVPRLGLIYDFTEEFGGKIVYSEAYRAAFGVETNFKLILRNSDGSIRGGLVGNDKLKPEKISTLDLQLYFQTEKLQMSATYYKSQEKNLIARERVEGVFHFINKGELKLSGFEFEGKTTLGENLLLTLAASYQENETVPLTDDEVKIENYTFIPNLMIKSGASYRFSEAVSLSIFDTFLDDAGDVFVRSPAVKNVNPKAAAHHLLTGNLNLNLNRLFHNKSAIQFRSQLYIYNLLNEKIYHPEFIGRRINTLPARSERAFYLKFSLGF